MQIQKEKEIANAAAPIPVNPFRNIGATLAGLVVFILVVVAMEALSSALFANAAAGIDYKDPLVMAELVANTPVEAKLIVILGYFLGTLAGAYVAARNAANNRAWNPYIIGALFAISSYFNFTQIPHPTWMIISSLVAGALGIWLGARLGFAKIRSQGILQ